MATGLQSDIELRDVTMTVRLAGEPFHIVEDVSLSIGSAETVALIGPSGCGKTSLLNLIAGFLLPTSGTVTTAGCPVRGPGADRAVVFQADAVFPWLTVRRNLEYGPRIQKTFASTTAARVDYYLDALGLREFEHAYPKVLSGGMRKRVDIGRAYISDPSVILLDEPFGALDYMTKYALQEELMSLSVSDPKTTVFVTHDIEEAIYLGDRVAVMDTRPGRIKTIVEVPFARPRPAQLRTAPEFQALRREIMGLFESLGKRRADASSKGATAIGAEARV
jgi:NitT/TauT family transport system ATP-binding protein